MEHRTRTLARTDQCSVALCSCGVVHVTVGGTTVRIRAEAAAQLRDVLAAALPQIEAEAKRPTLRLAPREGDLSS